MFLAFLFTYTIAVFIIFILSFINFLDYCFCVANYDCREVTRPLWLMWFWMIDFFSGSNEMLDLDCREQSSLFMLKPSFV